MTVPMLLDLVAAALAGGAAPPRAVAVVAECLDRSGDPAAAALRAFAVRLTSGQPTARGDDEHSAVASLAAALELAMAVGAGPVGLIRAAAEDRRRQSHDEEVRAAHRLAVLVLLPTGLCLLPAFVLLTVVPIVIDLVVG
jgi:hypothetical protein